MLINKKRHIVFGVIILILGLSFCINPKATWQAPQNILGNAYASIIEARVLSEYNYDDVIIYETDRAYLGFTLGEHIFLGKQASFNGNIYTHEFGHVVQSRSWGWLYLPIIAIPSFVTSAFSEKGFHNRTWYERDASQKGPEYLKKLDPEYVPIGGWRRYEWLFDQKL